MTNVSDPGKSPGNPPKQVRPSLPKRGAFPAPQSEIENAKAYIPDVGEEEDDPEGNPSRPTNIEGEKGS